MLDLCHQCGKDDAVERWLDYWNTLLVDEVIQMFCDRTTSQEKGLLQSEAAMPRAMAPSIRTLRRAMQ